jgi:hypothetical protein
MAYATHFKVTTVADLLLGRRRVEFKMFTVQYTE